MIASVSCQAPRPLTLEIGAVKLQSESVMAATFSIKEVFDLVTADNDLGVLKVTAVTIKAKTFMLTGENTVLVAWTSKAFRK